MISHTLFQTELQLLGFICTKIWLRLQNFYLKQVGCGEIQGDEK